jgi:hypothetical protein
VTLYALPDIFSEEHFLAHVSGERLREPGIGRFRLLENEESVDRSRETYCVRYRTMSEDRSATVQSGRTAMMVTDMSGYHCRHPRNHTIG